MRDLTASMLRNVCHDVRVEPNLQPLSGEVMAHRTAIYCGRWSPTGCFCTWILGGEGLKGHFLM